MQSTHSNFSFFLVTDVEIAETATSFLACQDIYLYNDLSAYRYSI